MKLDPDESSTFFWHRQSISTANTMWRLFSLVAVSCFTSSNDQYVVQFIHFIIFCLVNGPDAKSEISSV